MSGQACAAMGFVGIWAFSILFTALFGRKAPGLTLSDGGISTQDVRLLSTAFEVMCFFSKYSFVCSDFLKQLEVFCIMKAWHLYLLWFCMSVIT